MKERQCLKAGDIIQLIDRAGAKRTFKISSKVSSKGATAVCYEAVYGASGKGVLKEFYPIDAYSLERDENNQLVPSADFRNARELFLKEKELYTEPYEMLLKLKQEGDNPDLSTFIPVLDIYYGCDKDGKDIGSVYIWTPEPKLETFENFCRNIHEHPDDRPENKMVTVLHAIYTLTNCIRILHSEGLIHRDINPSNFGFKKRGENILFQTLSLFDINTICSVYDEKIDIVETEGYLEPEGKTEPANNQTDIYAIGATLFHAIVVSDETRENNYLYKEDYYDRLHEMIKDSKLIKASEANSHPRLINALTKVLQKSLCARSERYENCEQMLDDLGEALYYALPTELATKQQAGQKWILEDVEKSMDPNREKNSSLAIQYHLYEHPLYQKVKKDEKSINVLVIGFGNYGQKFLDACLQVGQIRDKELNVTVISDNATDKEIYLSDRPELGEFFNIQTVKNNTVSEGALANSDKEVYGSILFANSKLKRNDAEANVKVIEDILTKHDDEGERPHYVFIALGEDDLNFVTASACVDAIEAFEWDCIVNYVIENKKYKKEGFIKDAAYPLLVNEKIDKLPLYSQIERMAFNTHLIWSKDLNVDFNDVKSEFHEPYNHDSSVGSVLSMKYKLHSMGIELEATDEGCTRAAKDFNEKIADKNNNQLRNDLIWVEHRRWVTEKLCLGWRKKEIKTCEDGQTKDDVKKQHVCIVRSRPDQMLADNWDHAKWDKDNKKADLEKLDELDRMSVELHRFYTKKAKKVKKQEILSEDGDIISEIMSLIENNKQVTIAFQEWYDCLKDIWNGDTEKIHLYAGLKSAFLNVAENKLSKDKLESLNSQMTTLDVQFMPILKGMEYRDWKQDDAALVDNIPFILTYSENTCMVIPYSVGDNTEIFENVAAPTLVNPKKITYFYYMGEMSDWDKFNNSLPGIVEYMKKKKLRAAIDVIILYEGNREIKGLKDSIKKTGEDLIGEVHLIYGPKKEELPSKLQIQLMIDNQESMVAIEKNDTDFSSYLDGAGFYSNFPYFEFDSRGMKFQHISNCDMFGYIQKKPYITVAEMLSLSKISNKKNSQPEFFEDYQKLWEEYRGNTIAWKSLCGQLKDYCDKKDVIVTFNKKSRSDERETYEYIIPFSCKKSVSKILSYFQSHRILDGDGYRIYAYSSDSCKIKIIDAYNNKNKYNELFSNLYSLMNPDAVSVCEKRRSIEVRFDNLIVSNASILITNKDGERNEDLISAMNKLANDLRDDGYIINLKERDDKLSFTFGSRQIKELLTQEGKMLEVYVYHKALEQEQFNDVVSGYEIDWEQSDVNNEFDCIITKGFQTLFVECKARSRIDQNFYYKLSALTSKFGVNAKAVLIADTDEQPRWFDAINNNEQRQRGEGLDIVTIWQKEEIEDVGNTLLKVIDGTYKNKTGASN